MAEATKIEITNHTTRNLDFPIGVKDGAVVTDHVPPGETKGIAISPNDPYLRGLVGAMAVSVKAPTGALKTAQEAAKAGVQAEPTETEVASKKS